MSNDTLETHSDDALPERPDAVQSASPGKILAARRQELNWSVEDVAHSLHLAPRQIQAIEDDNYGALPGMAVTRGFIRSYAKLLKLDSAPLLQSIAKEPDARAEDTVLRRPLPDKPFYPNRALHLGTSSRSWLRIVLWLVLILLVICLVAWRAGFLPAAWMAEAEKLLPAQATADKARQPASIAHEPRASVAVPAGPAGSAAASATFESPQSATVSAASAVETQASQSADQTASKELLVLKLREDSWIEVRNARDKVLISRLAKAGESEAIPVNEALKLTIGNASGVDAQLRGVPVELNASTKSNVARLTVN